MCNYSEDIEQQVVELSEAEIKDFAQKGRAESFILLDAMIEAGFSYQQLLESLCRSLSVDEVADNLAYICRVSDIEAEVSEYLSVNNHI